MCYTGRPLLAAVMLISLYSRVSAAEQLGMAPNAVHDLYKGCQEKAVEKFVRSGVLQQELNNSQEFQRAWDTKCSTIIPGGLKEHTSALLAYAGGSRSFRKSFNDEVEMTGGNVSQYEKNFHFKSLHFLLTDAIRLMSSKRCINGYRMSGKPYKAQKGSKIRFGRFSTFNTDLSMKEDISEDIYFNITTCFFAKLAGFCGIAEDKAVLSPSEEFIVKDVIERQDVDITYTEIILVHSQLSAEHNCYSFSSSSAAISTPGPVLVLVALSLLHFNC